MSNGVWRARRLEFYDRMANFSVLLADGLMAIEMHGHFYLGGVSIRAKFLGPYFWRRVG